MRDKAAKGKAKATRTRTSVAVESRGEARARMGKKSRRAKRWEKREVGAEADGKLEVAAPATPAQPTSSGAPQGVERGAAPPMPVPIATFNV